MHYKSTRNHTDKVTASEAIIKGLADDGGLYVPDQLPKLNLTLSELSTRDYKETAFEILRLFLTDFSDDELRYCIENAYDDKFDTQEITPLIKTEQGYILELFHGPTLAFKDMALSILPYLLSIAAKKNQVVNDIVILTATSGDTGKAALEGFKDVEGTKIIVFYPKDGVSSIQEKQMLTQEGKNTFVVGIHGNFDDAQNGVKHIFNDIQVKQLLEQNQLQLSSANSINIGRLIPQVVYYAYTYGRLLKNNEIEEGEEINFVVPTGNFGNILAGFYAKAIGIPIKKLICASNDNKVLYDFLNTGEYNRDRNLILTNSPSMDILISSNLERLLYFLCDADDGTVIQLMNELAQKKSYTITETMKAKLHTFSSGYATELEALEEIKAVANDSSYVLDTHSAVASKVYRQYKEASQDNTKSIIVSTASPYKFPQSVLEALVGEEEALEDIELLKKLNKISGVTIPKSIEGLFEKDELHHVTCEIEDMKQTVMRILNI